MSNLNPALTWRGRTASLCLALLLAVGIAARAVALLPNPQDSVRSFYDTLLTTMKAGATPGESGRHARLAPVIDRLFDVPAMARLAVGPSWETLSPTQQQQLTEAFAHYITATYADRIDNYSGEQLQVIGEQPTAGKLSSKPRSSKPPTNRSLSIIGCAPTGARGK